MEFLDTQIISYKFNNNTKLFDGDIKGKYISSIVALEFLSIMKENNAKMYPIKIKGMHLELRRIIHIDSPKHKIGRNLTDKCIIDLNGEFDSIVIYSNEAISELLNTGDIETLSIFAQNSLNKKERKKFLEKAKFLIDNDIIVVPITQTTINIMQRVYEEIKSEYNVKSNYRNSFMDLLILATAIEKRKMLITKDKELNKVIKKCCKYLDVNNYSNEILSISYREDKDKKSGNKNYVNNGWKLMIRKKSIY